MRNLQNALDSDDEGSVEAKTPPSSSNAAGPDSTAAQAENKKKKKKKKKRKKKSNGSDAAPVRDIEMGAVGASTGTAVVLAGTGGENDVEFAKSLNKDTERFTKDLKDIERAASRISEYAKRFELAAGQDEEKRLEDKYSFACGKATSAIASGKAQIEAMRAKFKKEDAEDPERGRKDPRCKMERNMYQLLARKYAASAGKYRDSRVVFDKAVRSKLTRQLRIFDKDITDKKVEEIISSGTADAYMQQLVAYGQQSSELQNWFSKAQDQRGALLELEESINELQECFHEMATLVETQGGMLDNIEANVDSAVENVEHGNEQMIGAIQKKRRRRMCMLICGAVVLVLIIVLVVVLITQLT